MRTPSCEHVSPSHYPSELCLALASPLFKGSIYIYSGASAKGLPQGSCSGWPDSQDLALGTTGDSGDETDTSDIIPSQGLPQKREACLTHRLECLFMVTQHQSVIRTQQMQLPPALSAA